MQLQGFVKGVCDAVVSYAKQEPAATRLPCSTAMLDYCDDQLELARINELEVGNVRDVVEKAMIKEKMGSKERNQAMPSRARAVGILHEA
eukprot:contig_25978_g6397